MINYSPREVLLNVKLLTDTKNFYKVRQRVELTNPHDVRMTIAGCQRPCVNHQAIDINNLQDNVAIILQTLKNKCVINVNPARQEIFLVHDQLGQVLADLRTKIKKSYDGVVGLVVGGRTYDTSNKFADKGVQLTDAICEFMENEHIPSTKLLEQRLGRNTKGIDIYSNRDNAVLSGGKINQFSGVDSNAQEEIQAIGEEFFDIFEISPHAPISIVDKIEAAPSTNLRYR